MSVILVAGGTGLVGKNLIAKLKSKNYDVRCLTRGKTDTKNGLFHWNSYEKTIDSNALEQVEIVINLSGAGVTDKRWTTSRKKELMDSRVKSTAYLYEVLKDSNTLKHYLSASGAVCYGYENPTKTFVVSDDFGKDELGKITQAWEKAATVFSFKCAVTKLRIGMVFAKEGGAIPVMAKPVKFGFGAILGTGKQFAPWIHIDDLSNQFIQCFEQQIEGVVHAVAANDTNEKITKAIAKRLGKKLWLPKAPAFILKLILGEMAELLLESTTVEIDNRFHYQYNNLEKAVENCL